jgi:hypothetical protein
MVYDDGDGVDAPAFYTPALVLERFVSAAAESSVLGWMSM